MKSTARMVRGESKKKVARIFDSLSDRHSRWTIWADFVSLAAISISNIVDKSNAEQREKTYMNTIKKYNAREAEMLADMFIAVIAGMDESQDQDFLGELYMSLELGNQYKGQFFTPYSLCACMAQITSGDLKAEIEAKGWIGVSDPACGAGALLVAFANECVRQKVNYHDHVLFVAQDVDYTVAMMCYIQLSLLGCAGYVVVDNTLTNPSVSHDKRGLIPVHGSNIWYTPFYFKDTWHFRRLWAQMDMLLQSRVSAEPAPKASEPVIAKEFKADKGGQLTLF